MPTAPPPPAAGNGAGAPPSVRATVRRLPERGHYDRAQAYAILDEGLVAHVGVTTDDGPVVIPMLYGRDGDRLLLHGSPASRLLRAGKGGTAMCVAVTLVDGLVLARSAFHHSINYRSVVVFGRARPVEPEEERLRALELFTEKLVPGRWPAVRPPTRQELKATRVLSLPLDEASAKIRSGPPVDDEPDYELPVWAGVLPMRTEVGDPEPDPRLDSALELPANVADWRG